MKRVRVAMLTAVVALAVLLPLAGAFAGQTAEDGAPAPVRAEAATGSADAAERGAGAGEGDGPESGRRVAGAERCGPELASPDGIEAQTCVLFQDERTWARTYYRNATGERLRAALSLLGPGGRSVQTHCAVAAGDGPGACDTPRERTAGGRSAYTAVAEFASPERQPGLLLRVGSNPA
ncbi:hypothetical protein ACX6XY_22965 [Streptomyces sp. O3]